MVESYRCNALSACDTLLSPHKLYIQLGVNDDELRVAVYRSLFQTSLDTYVLEEMRACLQSGTPLGHERFKIQIALALKVKVGQAKRGRPRKKKL